MFMCSLRAHGGERNFQVSGLLLIWGFPHNMNLQYLGVYIGVPLFWETTSFVFHGQSLRWNFSAKLTRQSSRLMGIPRIHVLQSGTSMVQPGSRNHALQNSTQSCGQPLKDSMNRDRGVSCSTRVKKTIFHLRQAMFEGRPFHTSCLYVTLCIPHMRRASMEEQTRHSALPTMKVHMSGCQNYGPFLGSQNIRRRIIIGTQKGTIILTTTHMVLPVLAGPTAPAARPNAGPRQRNKARGKPWHA